MSASRQSKPVADKSRALHYSEAAGAGNPSCLDLPRANSLTRWPQDGQPWAARFVAALGVATVTALLRDGGDAVGAPLMVRPVASENLYAGVMTG